MRVQVSHSLGHHGGRTRVAGFVDGLARRAWPAGVDVRDPRATWTGDRLDFSCALTRGIFSLPLRGWLDVFETEVILEAEIPPMLMSLAGEDRIRSVIGGELERLLQPATPAERGPTEA